MLHKKLTTPKLDFYKQQINNIAYSFYFHYAKKFTILNETNLSCSISIFMQIIKPIRAYIIIELMYFWKPK